MKSNAILTTTVGSFPRQKALVELLWEKERGGTDISEQVQAATTDIVKSQVEAGLAIVSNGEMGRLAFASWVPKRLTGFSGEDTPFLIKDLVEFPEFSQRLWATHSPHFPHTPMCVGPTSYQANDVQQELEQFRVALQAAPATGFFTSTSPGNIALIHQDRHYHNHETYLSSIAQAMKEEYKIIASEYLLQIDSPDIPMAWNTSRLGNMTLKEYRAYTWQSIEALNFALEGINPEKVRVHLCWGNYRGPHTHDIPLEAILDIVLALRVGAFSIELANRRHAYEWRLFEDSRTRLLLDGRTLLPGVIDTNTDTVEHPETVAMEIMRLARLLGKEQIMAGTDCGFGTYAAQPSDPKVVWAKVRSLVRGAELASRELWK